MAKKKGGKPRVILNRNFKNEMTFKIRDAALNLQAISELADEWREQTEILMDEIIMLKIELEDFKK